MDIGDPASVDTAMDAFRPWAVVNAAGYVRVDDAEADVAGCLRENRDGPALLAAACAKHGAALVTFSSDLVFDGSKAEPYVESDAAAPLSVYGRSKSEAEALVLARHPSALVVRTSAFFGPWDDYNFVTLALRTLAGGGAWTAGSATVTATYVPDLVNATLDLLIDGESGIWHLANPGPITWVELARRAAIVAGLDPRRVLEREPDPPLPAARPAWSPLASERGELLPPLDDALMRYVGETGILDRALEA
jgi:dTDP-4-dehydrorhamnose reductase